MTATSARSRSSATGQKVVRASGPPAWGRRTRWASATVRCASAGAVLFGLAACNDANDIAVHNPTTSSPTASPTPTGTSEQHAVLDQYRKFWSSLTPVSQMPAAQRRATLTPFTMDPELKSMLAGLLKLDNQARVLYGENHPRPLVTVAPDGASAVVNDCQDSSAAGTADRASLAHLTVGVARNHVVVTMRRQAGTWKVYFVSYSKTPC